VKFPSFAMMALPAAVFIAKLGSFTHYDRSSYRPKAVGFNLLDIRIVFHARNQWHLC